ncbi:Response regulator of zinc sigma-54-dependent two-component system [Enhygromyxa salina]|uniref:Response regulator of zinc sigma-54-dependent two-component system n=1 Tax=Enhygromyxa salina TaxID=215803 RepID=A0A0C2D9W1_9BACT|nr:sigma-54 dependent transcriptional regulator [Enhygromyxa salina]KIG18350.1 Response regulator of zinc sigma-54-dependent two-component system [Enhygromyxa salina]
MDSKILVVDDDLDTRELLCANLRAQGYQASAVGSGEAALEQLEADPFDALLTDVHMDGLSGVELCTRVRARYPNMPVLVMTGKANMATAVAALRAGAHDFASKPVDLQQILHRLERALHQAALEDEVHRLRRMIHRADASTLIGESSAMARTQSLIERVADADVPVLVTGESGVGKELVARELHRQSERAEQPFVAINCAAIPPQLLESELFGHVRGAFTGAQRSRDGLFVQAGRGTVFLDEIGELPIEMQPKLLRALQERSVRAVGSDKTVAVGARVVAATNRDIETEVEEKRFREDLFYRINVVNIHVAPLRVRGRDVLLLAQFFLTRIAERSGKPVKGITAAVADKLLAYDWPGNVRELENCMERAVALARYDELTLADLPDKVTCYEHAKLVIHAAEPEELITLAELEGRYIRRVLEAVEGNKTRAAEVLGLARRTLYRRLGRLEDGPGNEAEQEGGQ